jgi:hypothetical protein
MSVSRQYNAWLPVIGAVVGGAVGAFITLMLSRAFAPASNERPRAELTVASPGSSGAELQGRLTALERAVQQLALRQSIAAKLENLAPGGRETTPKPVTDVAPIVDNPVFEAAVRDVMERAEQARQQEREEQRSEWRRRTAEDWANQLGERLRLTDTQKTKVVENRKRLLGTGP